MRLERRFEMEKNVKVKGIKWHKLSEERPPVGELLIVSYQDNLDFPAIYLENVPSLTHGFGRLDFGETGDAIYIMYENQYEQGFTLSPDYSYGTPECVYWALLSDLKIEEVEE